MTWFPLGSACCLLDRFYVFAEFITDMIQDICSTGTNSRRYLKASSVEGSCNPTDVSHSFSKDHCLWRISLLKTGPPSISETVLRHLFYTMWLSKIFISCVKTDSLWTLAHGSTPLHYFKTTHTIFALYWGTGFYWSVSCLMVLGGLGTLGYADLQKTTVFSALWGAIKSL